MSEEICSANPNDTRCSRYNIINRDCEGTQWIKQQSCSLNGKPMDGIEVSCGLDKLIYNVYI